MAVNWPEFKLIRIFYRGVKAGVDNCLKTTQDERLAKYVLQELRRRNELYNKDYFAVPAVENTSVLRDYVHHKLTKQHETLEMVSYEGLFSQTTS